MVLWSDVGWGSGCLSAWLKWTSKWLRWGCHQSNGTWPLCTAWASCSMASGSPEGSPTGKHLDSLGSQRQCRSCMISSDLAWDITSATFPEFCWLQGHPSCNERGIRPHLLKGEMSKNLWHLNMPKTGQLATNNPPSQNAHKNSFQKRYNNLRKNLFQGLLPVYSL